MRTSNRGRLEVGSDHIGRTRSLVAALALLTVGLTGCQGAAAGDKGQSTPAAASVQASAPAVPPAQLSFVPASGSKDVRPDEKVMASVSGGKISSATLTDASGKAVSGDIDAASGQWVANGSLTTGATYTLTASATNDDGKSVTQSSTFTTLKPQNTTQATILPGDDWTVGVAMPVILTFAKPVKNRAAIEKALSITSTPEVVGAWRWFSNTEIHYRPKDFWPTGTKVQVKADLASVEVSPGSWGRKNVTTQFAIGARQILDVDVASHQLVMSRNGKVINTIPVTTGKPGYKTRGGTKVVMSREPSVNMDASSVGTAKDDPDYYNLNVKWAMRLTWSGEYLHAAPWSVGYQGHANVSHGCTGMSNSNAKWLYDNVQVGDPVVYKNSSRKLEPGNGYTDWDMSFAEYSKNSVPQAG